MINGMKLEGSPKQSSKGTGTQGIEVPFQKSVHQRVQESTEIIGSTVAPPKQVE